MSTRKTPRILVEPLPLGRLEPLEGPDLERLERAGAAGLRAFYRIMAAWGLKVEEQMALLDVDARSTFSRWREAPPAKLGRDRLERISHILGIYKALRILLPDQAAADRWVTRPNQAPLFGGRRALDLMIAAGIPGLMAVRQYLDAQRGGWA